MNEVERRTGVAGRMGAEMFHPALEVGEAIRLLRAGQGERLDADERDAFDGLMPATFQAAFASGWNRARNASPV